MFEYKASVQDIYHQSFSNMGNYLDASFWSDGKMSPTSVVMIKNYISTAIHGSQPRVEESLCWYASIDDVESLDEGNELMMSLLPEETQKVKRFKFADDQKRALLSILLQRALVRTYYGINDHAYELIRSREGKPFARSRTNDRNFGTWNFNVSHHGRFVCIVAHPHVLMGADIVDMTSRSNMHKDSAMDFVRMFDSQLTPQEMRDIGRQRTETAKYSYFYLIWSLKEAFIKAIGQGLGYDLTQVEFSVHLEPGCDLNICPAPMAGPCQFVHTAGSTECKESWSPQSVAALGAQGQPSIKGYATVRVEGELRHDWRLEFASLDDKHMMTVARGPLHDALPTFIAQAGWPVTAGEAPRDAREIEQHRSALAVPIPLAQYRHARELLTAGR